MLEKNYQPDGWLGFVVGAKFWIDFTNRLTFNDDVVKLTKEVGERGMQVDEVIRAVDEVDLKGTSREIHIQARNGVFSRI